MYRKLSLVGVFVIMALGIAYMTNLAAKQVGLSKGDLAPEIKLAGPNGKEIPLSSLKGKMVLIDFWASWCGPCRVQNPKLVRLYQEFDQAKFRNAADGFTVYSVSLDRDRQSWVKAIDDDGLEWPNHVSDLKFWDNQAARRYQIDNIPSTFLVDGDGVIVGRNLTLQLLRYELEKRRVN